MSQLARFVLGTGAAPVETITGNSGGAVSPNGSGNINIVGGSLITAVGNPGTFTETISLTNGTNGQVIIGGGASPAWATLTSTGSTIVFTPGANTLNLEAAAALPTTYTTDAGNAVPALHVLNELGGTNINTAGAGNTVTINLDSNLTGIGNVTFLAGGALRTGTTAADTLLLQAYDNTGAAYTTFGTLTAGLTPTFNLSDTTTKAGQYIYRVAGTDVAITDGGTGISTTPTDGQLLIGNTAGNNYVLSTLTAGSGVGITNGGGSITISAPGLNESNIIYVGKHGNDANSGKTIGLAKLTFGAAITAAFAIAPAVVVCFDDGTYTENLTGQVGVDIDAMNATISGVHTMAAENHWTFNRATVATAVVGFAFNTGGSTAYLDLHQIEATGTGICFLSLAGSFHVECNEISIVDGFVVGSLTAANLRILNQRTAISGTGTVVGALSGGDIAWTGNEIMDAGAGTLALTIAASTARIGFNLALLDIANLSNIVATTLLYVTSASMHGTLLEIGAGSATAINTGERIALETAGGFGTTKVAAATALLQAYNTLAGSYTTFGTLTAGNPPTFDLADTVTKASGYIYRAGGTDVPVADGGTGNSTMSAYAVVCGGTTTTNPLQSVAALGSAGDVLTSNGAGALPTFQTPSSSGSFVWSNVAGTTQAMATDHGYVIGNAGTTTCTLPGTAAIGKAFAIAGNGAGGWILAQNAGQTVHFGNQNTTTGAGGSLASTHQYDCVYLVCVVADTDFVVINSVGTLTVT